MKRKWRYLVIKKRAIGLSAGLLAIIWAIYFYKAASVFSEVKELVTEGSSYIIQLLEFTNYRGQELILSLSIYFILISLSNYLTLYFAKAIVGKGRKKTISIMLAVSLVLTLVACLIASIYWLVMILLSLLSGLIVIASIYVSNVLFSSAIEFDIDDLIVESHDYSSQEQAQEKLKETLALLSSEEQEKVIGEIIEEDGTYGYEIVAKEKIVLDKKGAFIINEKI